jgi:hypothetical protein
MPNPIIGLGIQGIHSEDIQSANQGFVSIVSVDNGSAAAGQTIGASQTTQATGYQIVAADTWFSTVTPAPTGNGNTPTAAAVLPLTGSLTSPKCLVGAVFKIINTGANPINVYANPGDTSNSINGQATNLPVVLGVNTITPFECVAPGIWFADGIGEGQAGQIATNVSQGSVTATASATQSTATPITQAMLTCPTNTSGAGLLLPSAQAGMQITINFTGTIGDVVVFPAVGQQINTNGANASYTPTVSPTIFMCFTAGQWWTK